VTGNVPDPPAAADPVAALMLIVTQLTERNADLEATVAKMSTSLSNCWRKTMGQQQQLASQDGLAESVATTLAAFGERLAAAEGREAEGDDEDSDKWMPPPTFDWWDTYDDIADPVEREKLAGRRQSRADYLITWATDIYRYAYGHISEPLPACWPDHPLVMHIIDTMSAMWAYYYTRPTRTPGNLREQAQMQVQYMPVWSRQIETELKRCQDGRHVAPYGVPEQDGDRHGT
jgi:hypothetical protein